MSTSVWVRSVEVEQHRICAPTAGQDPNDCDKHDHVPGGKELRVGLDVAGGSEDEWRSLVGKRLPLATLESRRAGLERAVRAAAVWGFSMAQLGHREPVVPRLVWDDNGVPRIVDSQPLRWSDLWEPGA